MVCWHNKYFLYVGDFNLQYFLIEGCMNDIRYDGEWLPMEMSENKESTSAQYTSRSMNVHDGCGSNACFNVAINCIQGLTCVDLWRHAECRYCVYHHSLLQNVFTIFDMQCGSSPTKEMTTLQTHFPCERM